MHSYLRSIGFSEIHKVTDRNDLLRETVQSADHRKIFRTPDGRTLAEMTKSYGPGFGLAVVGEYDDKDIFYAQYMFPYGQSRLVSSTEDVIVEKHASNDSLTGAVDDLRVGTTIIFFLQNAGEYMVRREQNTLYWGSKNTYFTAMATEGTVLLPVEKEEGAAVPTMSGPDYADLIRAAREGDEDAIESLTLEDLDTYRMISERVSKEDVLSIVDTYFMPDGADCECYGVLGTILTVSSAQNEKTGEVVVRMTIDCNDIKMDVLMNTVDLVGEPVPGRRFKGVVWLQGFVDFS